MTSLAVSPVSADTRPLSREGAGTQDLASWHYAIIKLRADGTFGCPRPRGPVAPGQLSLVDPASTLDAQHRSWRWAESLREAMAETGQSAPAASVQSRAVMRILAGAAGETTDDVVPLHVVGTGELVLLAALALARGDADAAEAVLEPVAGLPASGEDTPMAHRLSVAFAQLGVARLRGRTEVGEGLAALTRGLLARLPVAQLDHLPGLSVMLDAHVGSLLVSGGRLDEATRVLVRGAEAVADSSAGRAARADCLGQLALVEAFQGDLRRAARDARLVLDGPTDAAPAGVVQANLATAWVHLERGEVDLARRGLDAVSAVGADTHEPWLVVAKLVADARVLEQDGLPEAAVRLLAQATGTSRGEVPCWLDELVVVASAEASISAGMARRALTVLTPPPSSLGVQAGVVAAAALLEIGDLRGARAALAGVAATADRAPLGDQIRCWLLEARIAHLEQAMDPARCLVDRALRVASEEGMTRPLRPDAVWLRALVERDVSLLRRHRALIETLPREAARLPQAGGGPSPSARALVENLTEREVQVLELLAQMFSTDEIARDLYVSANTVKTHLKGIFRKLAVNRRVDAVRRGRELGLC